MIDPCLGLQIAVQGVLFLAVCALGGHSDV